MAIFSAHRLTQELLTLCIPCFHRLIQRRVPTIISDIHLCATLDKYAGCIRMTSPDSQV